MKPNYVVLVFGKIRTYFKEKRKNFTCPSEILMKEERTFIQLYPQMGL